METYLIWVEMQSFLPPSMPAHTLRGELHASREYTFCLLTDYYTGMLPDPIKHPSDKAFLLRRRSWAAGFNDLFSLDVETFRERVWISLIGILEPGLIRITLRLEDFLSSLFQKGTTFWDIPLSMYFPREISTFSSTWPGCIRQPIGLHTCSACPEIRTARED